MADIIFDCPKCEGNLVVDDRGAGRTVQCPHCQKLIQIPTPSEANAAEGSDEPVMMNTLVACPHCGADNDSRASNCVRCGKVMAIGGYASTQGRVSEPERSSKPALASLNPNPIPPHLMQSTPLPIGKTCEYCGANCRPNVIICESCGRNRITGIAMQPPKCVTKKPRKHLIDTSAEGNSRSLQQLFLLVGIIAIVIWLAKGIGNKSEGQSSPSGSDAGHVVQNQPPNSNATLLDAQIEAARKANTYVEGIRILEKAIAEYPNQPNTATAEALLASFQDELGQSMQLYRAMENAKQQRNYPDAIAILQSGLRDYPRAGNRNEALNLMNFYQQQLSSARFALVARQRYGNLVECYEREEDAQRASDEKLEATEEQASRWQIKADAYRGGYGSYPGEPPQVYSWKVKYDDDLGCYVTYPTDP